MKTMEGMILAKSPSVIILGSLGWGEGGVEIVIFSLLTSHCIPEHENIGNFILSGVNIPHLLV